LVDISPWAWAGFLGLVGLLLALDLGVFHRNPHLIKLKEAAGWATLWISIGVGFSGVVWWLYANSGGPEAGHEAAQLYLTGFILEKALSVDNLFVFLVIFKFFDVAGRHQHRVLYWGILGALIMRGAFIFAGTTALHAYEPAIYGLAVLLIFTAFKLAFSGDSTLDPAQSRMYRLLKRVLPLSAAPHEGHFFHREGGRRLATSLFLCLMLLETTDVLFALDSVPAVLGVTSDPFIVYTSNIFAILGLRSLYFVVAAGLHTLRYLKPGLVLLLLFIGVKMILTGPLWSPLEIPVTASLTAVLVILGVATGASVVHNRRHPEEPVPADAPPPGHYLADPPPPS